ncbi:hypothetical protein PpBr36_00087 [Pyricularia pennisetigena]|uniref:hypothetical protein n=1 Tax=Pyricularia pennisetigena TaxID=1578925 RepID=UPI001153561C|nr:hypothetical protein PpBr36_00087 [Pyricularia pennisetigena]TLS29030.1 hypothetical protein PpBr36_00087 [Pyricularia pennisetigena]
MEQPETTISGSSSRTAVTTTSAVPRHRFLCRPCLGGEMVDANGRLLTLNECGNEDLFFAVRGGGGLTFGILTSITIRALEFPKVLGLRFSMLTSTDSP